MNNESIIISGIINDKWREIYKCEEIIKNLKNEIEKNRKKII